MEVDRICKEGVNYEVGHRARPKVDRVACPWLIKKFVDPQAELRYVTPEQGMELAKRQDAIPFDVANVELGDYGSECSFDAIIKKYKESDPELQRPAPFVRGADTDARISCENRVARGDRRRLPARLPKRSRALERESPVYDVLYAYCQQIVRSKTSERKLKSRG